LICQVYKERGLELLYQCDAYNDEMPYWEKHPLVEADKRLLTIPHTLDVNDAKYTTNLGHSNPRVGRLLPMLIMNYCYCPHPYQDWLEYAKLAFDVMYEEGCRGELKMYSVSLHSRLVGKLARLWALRELIDYI
jgi:hypothetical protein